MVPPVDEADAVRFPILPTLNVPSISSVLPGVDVPMPTIPLLSTVKILDEVAIVRSAPFGAVEVPIITLPPALMLNIWLDVAIVKSVLDAG